ncbi:MAG: hypothetical protein JXR76_00570 [Deltaproteobacteria bacterium]|nr:hypothetical protein [Deltaproteobacteria bacterium]
MDNTDATAEEVLDSTFDKGDTASSTEVDVTIDTHMKADSDTVSPDDSATAIVADTGSAGYDTDLNTDSDSMTNLVCLGLNAAPPGVAIADPNTGGSGVCDGFTMGTVLDRIFATDMDVADIKAIYDASKDGTYGGSKTVYPFLKEDGGFAFAFWRGWGDCPSGCISNQWEYFETNQSCEAVNTGSYLYYYDDSDNCMMATGVARWGHPMPANPENLCSADNLPQDISGSYSVAASGEFSPCGVTANDQPVDTTLFITIEQNPADLSTGTVTIGGFAHRLLDAPLPATFSRRRVTVALATDNLPSNCPDGYTLEFDLNLECQGAQQLSFLEYGACGTDICCDTCKGYGLLNLGGQQQ